MFSCQHEAEYKRCDVLSSLFDILSEICSYIGALFSLNTAYKLQEGGGADSWAAMAAVVNNRLYKMVVPASLKPTGKYTTFMAHTVLTLYMIGYSWANSHDSRLKIKYAKSRAARTYVTWLPTCFRETGVILRGHV